QYVACEATLDEWESLLERFPHHSVFHRLPWLQAIEAAHNAKLRLLRVDAARGSRSKTLAVWPVFATRRGPLHILGSPLPGWSTPSLGPLLAPGCDDADAILKALLDHELVRRCSYFACKSLNTGEQPVELAAHGFENVLNFETYCLDLTVGIDALWRNLK